MLQFLIKNRAGVILFFSGHYYYTEEEAITNGNWHIKDYYNSNFADYTAEVGDNNVTVSETVEATELV